MILLIISSASAVLLGYFVIQRVVRKYSEKSLADISDANYLLKKEIDDSRKRAFHLQHSLREVKESMELLQVEKNSLLNKQYDFLGDQKENLKKWTDEAKN